MAGVQHTCMHACVWREHWLGRVSEVRASWLSLLMWRRLVLLGWYCMYLTWERRFNIVASKRLTGPNLEVLYMYLTGSRRKKRPF